MFLLQRKTPTTDFVDVYSGPSNTFTDTGLTPESTYIYRARVEGEHGVSAWSPEVTALTREGGPVVFIRFRDLVAGNVQNNTIVVGA